jgi:fucose permease
VIRNPRVITGASFLSMFFLGVGGALVGAAARDIGLSPTQIGLMLAAQSAGLGIAVIIAGALSDTQPKPRILFYGSLLSAASFLAFYAVPGFWFNLAVMLLLGTGTGAYEGAADAMLFDLHEKRAGLFININHLFVTLGGGVIALYLIFLQVGWRTAVIQAGLVVAVLAAVFALIRLPVTRGDQATLGQKLRVVVRSRLIAVLFVTAVLAVGVETSSIGIMSTFLAELRGFATLPAKLGLVVFLAGVASGRFLVGYLAKPERLRRLILTLLSVSAVTFSLLFMVDLGPLVLPVAFLAGLSLSAQLPLILTYAGLQFRGMTGTVLGAVKIAIPIGGILMPALISAVTSAASFGVAVLLIPASLLPALALFALGGRAAAAVLEPSMPTAEEAA